MKKNLFMSMLAIAGMLFATSCSQDELLNEPTTGDYVRCKVHNWYIRWYCHPCNNRKWHKSR